MDVETMKTLSAAAGVITGCGAAAAVVWRVVHTLQAVMEGIRCQLRTDMLRVYYRHKNDRVIRQYEKENFEHNYNAYTALGGNSFIGDIHEEVRRWKVDR